MMDYGREIAGFRMMDTVPRLKNRIMTRLQYRVLAAFADLEEKGSADSLFAKLARTLLGAHLYSIKLELNTACTLNCKMCYIENGNESLPPDLLESLFDQLRGYGVRIELLGGEPLLREDITRIIAGAKQRAESPMVTLYTNGIHAEPELSRRLALAGLDAALVTLVSHRPEVHDEFCGVEGTWDRTVEGIRNLKQAGITVYTFTAIHRDNCRNYQKIYRFVREDLGVHPTFYQYIPQRKDDPLELCPEDWSEVKRWVINNTSKSHMEFVRRFYMLTGSACSGGNFVLTIKADGSVQPCPFVSDIQLGNVYEQNIWSIYRNRYRNTRLGEFKRLPDECRSCTYRSVCAGGCRAACGTLYDAYDRKDQRCLGPYSELLDRNSVLNRVPTFF